MRKVYLMMDKASEFREKVSRKEYPPNFLFGCLDLENRGIVTILDQNKKSILRSKRNSIFIVNRIKYILLLKLLGMRVIYININSNHDIRKLNRTGLKNFLLRIFYTISYKICDKIICLSPTQIKELNRMGVKKIRVIPLGVDQKLFRNKSLKKDGEYYLSAGLDEGRDFNFIKQALKGRRYIILDKRNRLSYLNYLKVLSQCKALIINISDNDRASDLSGVTTCCEALLMRKPVYINYQPWLKELLKENYYIYKDKKSLKDLLDKKTDFKSMYTKHLTLKNFQEGLIEEIKKLN